MNKVVHITSAHTRDDIRIFKKECISLSKSGIKVYLIVNDCLGNENVNNVSIIDAGRPISGRLDRFLNLSKYIYRAAIDLDADIYHFHDSDLIPVGLRLLKKNKKVVYDVHEDLPRQILTKEYIPSFFRKPVSLLLEFYENYASKQFDLILAATPHITERFRKLNKNTVNINNYPIHGELLFKKNHNIIKDNAVCYIGGISRIRGVKYLINALEHCNVNLYLAGRFSDKKFEQELRSLKNWKKVIYLGQIGREKVSEILSLASAGLVTFLPAPNHNNAQPNKMFEYMSAGLPVICSNFNLWKKIITENKCGICVNPVDSYEISSAINKIIEDKSLVAEFGKNGIESIKNKYNWNNEEKKLIKAYQKIK